jgi:hypothetical protein
VPDPADLAAWLLSAPEAAQVAAFCSGHCADTAPACALAVVEALGGQRTVLVLGSPSERLIPAETFSTSRRAKTALLRRVLLAVDARGRRLQLEQAQGRDACFAGALADEAQRYLPRRN